MPSTSGSSEETMMMDTPLGHEGVHDRVDLLLGPHVDAPRRLVEDQDVDLLHQAAGQQHLLLVAAAQVDDAGVQASGS